MTLLESKQLTVEIGGHTVCTDLDLCIEAGESWALLGRNGVGKSTLLHHLAGLRRAQRGEILLAGTPIATLRPRHRAQRVATLLQHSDPTFGGSVLDTVLTGRHPHLSALAWESENDLQFARDALAAVGLKGFERRALNSLSGGELRRVEIARLLAQQAPLALLDEPINHLDLAQQTAALQAVGTHCVSASRAMMLVMHDLNLAYRVCDRWLILDGNGQWHMGDRDALGDSELLSELFQQTIRRTETAHGPLFIADW